jgi:hypothetical protein
MRRVVGLILSGLGAFLVVLALFLRFYVAGLLIKFPLNEYTVTTLRGSGISYFSPKDLRENTGVTAVATNTVEGDVKAGSASTAVWNSFTAMEDTTNHEPIAYSYQRSAFDRRTGVLVNCCGAVIGSKRVHQSGQGYVWPFGTQKRTYPVFDTTLLRAVPFRYAGTTSIDGMTAYKFVERVSNQRFSQQTLPGSLVGIKDQASVTLPEYYTATNTYWVDPVTGGVLDVTENQTIALEDSTGATRLVLFRGYLAETPNSVRAAVNSAKPNHTKISLLTTVGPLVALLVGIVILIIGVALIGTERTRRQAEPDAGEQLNLTV